MHFFAPNWMCNQGKKMQKRQKRLATKHNTHHRSCQHCLVFCPKLRPQFTAGHIHVLKFQVHDFAPIYLQNFVVFPNYTDRDLECQWRLSSQLIKVVCFSKILIRCVQKFCTTRNRYWPIQSYKMSSHTYNPPFIIHHWLQKEIEKLLNTGKLILRSNFYLQMQVNFGYLFEEIYTCHW